MDHSGTPSSPILVVDSEDEVHGVLCRADDPDDQPRKRKRAPDFVQGSSSTVAPQESKKARKRRRRLERQTLGTETFAHQQRWYSEMASTTLWNPMVIADHAQTSDWVSAMAIAGSFPDSAAYVNQYQWPAQFVPAPSPPPNPSSPPPALLERVSSPQRLPKKPPSSPQHIGMAPDTEPHSKHGVFQFSSTNLSNRRSNASYIPNPACTIVMEQLPKTHRTIDFVKQWTKRASGVAPLCIVVDPPSAKALVEFSSAKLARKAWESPRLGAEYLGLKTHQLKGKPRIDQIRVWWYRVDGVGAGAGVGEIEEGEIDDDTLDRKGQPESKKARKARLARERLEKAAQRSAMRAQLDEVVKAEPANDGVDSIASSREPSIAPVVQDPAAADAVTVTAIATPVPANSVPATPILASPVPAAPVSPVSPPATTGPDPPATNLSEMKRALLAKQKELEEKIAQSKLEMSKMTSAPPPPPPPPEDNKAVEDRLRKLVLQSQKAKAQRAASPDLPTPSTSTGDSTPTAVQVHTSAVSSFSLEDLAVSFITETISTFQQSRNAAAPRPQPVRQNSNTKEELAARQKQLEEYIADSKTLMTQLTQARTKQEKDRLLVLMREKSRWVLLLSLIASFLLLWEDLYLYLRGVACRCRLMDEEKEKIAKATEGDGLPRRPSPEQKPVFSVRWPTMSKDGGIMIISDDSEEDDSE
ncbi:hypothetical protein AX14_008637 [Amanita brunnescens Koide BX004]|nr:hypothetical protein AX14_008637 [Amanita brunnescens Koide BX004]